MSRATRRQSLIDSIVALLLGLAVVLFTFYFFRGIADAATVTANSGTLQAGKAATGDLTNTVWVTGNRAALWITCSGNTGTVAWTVLQSPDNTNFGVVTLSGTANDSLTFADVDAAVPIFGPAGFYKVNLGTCTGCAFSCFYKISDEP